MSTLNIRAYLGDGAYAELHGYAVRIFTSDSTVTLEYEALIELLHFLRENGWKVPA